MEAAWWMENEYVYVINATFLIIQIRSLDYVYVLVLILS